MRSATQILALHILAKRLPPPVYELRFAPPRRFRFDVAFVEQKLAVEVDGATWRQGRHTRGAGHRSDCIKRNLAVEMNWRVLTYPTDLVMSGEAIRQIERMLKALPANGAGDGERRAAKKSAVCDGREPAARCSPQGMMSATEEAAKLLPCLDRWEIKEEPCECGTCRLRPAVEAALRERDQRIAALEEQLRLSIIDAAQNEAEANDLRAENERLKGARR